MSPLEQRFATAIDRFDDENRQDPRRVAANGQLVPHELLYAKRMTAWLEQICPDASEALRLAARCQHLRRWVIARESYPMDRAGYLRWRQDLAQYHAEEAGHILRQIGYDAPTIARVQSLLRKEHLKSDPDAQCLQDVAALVFLQYELADFVRKHVGEEEKIVRILGRTWKKMSPGGHAAAGRITLGPDERRLLDTALNPTLNSLPPGGREES